MGTLIALNKDLIWVNGGSSPTPPEPDIPDGTTAIPINDVVIWQKCAGLTQQYDTLAEVLADSGIVRTLMNSKNAVDYLVRSTGFAKSEALVPTMTSNTTPSGVCNGSSTISATAYFYAFDNNSANAWLPPASDTAPWISYQFASPKVIQAVSILFKNVGTSNTANVYVEGSNDNGSTWDLIHTEEIILNSEVQRFSFANSTAYKIVRIRFSVPLYISGQYNAYVDAIQFYNIGEGVTDSQTAMTYIGTNDYAANTLTSDPTWSDAICNSTYFESVLNAKVPKMTSATTPSGTVSASAQNNSYPAWYAFDENTGSAWSAYSGSSTQWIQYQFPRPVKLLIFRNVAGGGTYSFSLIGSNDGSTWSNPLLSGNNPASGDAKYPFPNRETFDRYRLSCTVSSGVPYIHEIQFYGRETGGVQTWLIAGDITDKNYVTLSEVLNDSVTLQALMQSENAVNYLVTCKKWISEICSNENAMTYIGYSNYASNTLLMDTAWRSAICASTYFNLILNVVTPSMTSATTPSGTVSASGSSGEYVPYRAFNYGGPVWYQGSNSSNGWIQYAFDEDVNIVMFNFNNYYGCAVPSLVKTKLDGSLSNTVSLSLPASSVFYQKKVLPADENTYGIYRFNVNANGSSQKGAQHIILYGRKDL